MREPFPNTGRATPTRLALSVALLLGAGCSAVATQLPSGQQALSPESGAAIGRLSFINTRRKIAVERFELAAVQVGSGKKFRIQFAPDGAPENGGSFFVSLPAGQYRLTEWLATAGDQQWAGADIGLAIDVVGGEVVCVGALFVKPNERRRFSLDDEAPSETMVRDECPALTELLRQRSPALTDAPVVRIARRVVTRRAGGT
jgi:hypothetical protein